MLNPRAIARVLGRSVDAGRYTAKLIPFTRAYHKKRLNLLVEEEDLVRHLMPGLDVESNAAVATILRNKYGI